MNKRIRFAIGDKVEIIDRTSQYFGKTGKLIEPRLVTATMMNSNRKPISSKEEYLWEVKLEDTETTVVFTFSQLRKI